MSKIYRISMWSSQIDEYEIVKLTDKSIWFLNSEGKEQRELLKTERTAWFESKNDAIEWKKSKLEFEVELKQDTLNYYQKKLDDFLLSNNM